MASRVDAPIQLSPELTEKFNTGAVQHAIKEFEKIDYARKTAGWQSGFGINGVLLFGSIAAIAATVASAGVLAPAAAGLLGLAAESSGIMTGISAILTAIGQGREQLNVRRYRKVKKRHNLGTQADYRLSA